MSNDSGSMIPPLPERSAAEQAARGGYAGQSAPQQSGPQPTPYPGQAQPSSFARPQATTAGEPTFVTPPQQAYAWAQPEPKQKKNKSGLGAKVAGLMVVAALIGGGVGLGGAWLGFSNFGGDSTQQLSSAATGAQNVTINNPDDVNETAAIAAKALPSVVTIEAASDSAGGSGSGVVLSEDGYVLTNTHVVTLGGEAAHAQLRVTMSDGTIYDATVVGTDPTYDLAVIKLEGASGLSPVTSPTPRSSTSVTPLSRSAPRWGSTTRSPRASSATSTARSRSRPPPRPTTSRRRRTVVSSSRRGSSTCRARSRVKARPRRASRSRSRCCRPMPRSTRATPAVRC
jgi:hypothetical protein